MNIDNSVQQGMQLCVFKPSNCFINNDEFKSLGLSEHIKESKYKNTITYAY